MMQILQLRRYTDAELMAAIIQSFIAIVYTQTGEEAAGNVFGENAAKNLNPGEYGLGNGTAIFAPAGYDVKPIIPTHPATKYPEFYHAVAEQVGASTGIPVGLLLKHHPDSYSASRAAMLDAWKDFSVQRNLFSRRWCIPMYEWWLTEAVSRGRAHAPGFLTDPVAHRAYLGSEWIGPPQGQIDPVKEVNSKILECLNGFNTWENATMQLGNGYFGDNIAKLREEVFQMHDAGLFPAGTGEIDE
jgi:capsid protein